ncbi:MULTISPECIES: DUF397 domain-containing protein [unclassified Streptomyces]|uniref:DUF397 domain-containing protein n=1 Tax=unclassified Streptomyces TaxID=2593676 RepID=UPI000DAC7E46|nr:MULTISPECIES: DUF397 domain-containing protein [unclassified Streptomyces]PZT74369.1 DUF397 domain-containing protein [Streptomyces sp. AC1-42T]PZT82641.1 DUF397 domain-containing protein [Streptomyces sp. AC1-42W]
MNDRRASLYAFDLSAAAWRKATASAGENNCVEVASLPNGGRAVRDSKDPDRTALRFTASEWAAFRAGVVADDF